MLNISARQNRILQFLRTRPNVCVKRKDICDFLESCGEDYTVSLKMISRDIDFMPDNAKIVSVSGRHGGIMYTGKKLRFDLTIEQIDALKRARDRAAADNDNRDVIILLDMLGENA